MSNLSLLQSNITQVSIPSSKLVEYTRLALTLLVAVGIGFFIFFFIMILNVFFPNPHFRDNARYVLFVYMLINDILYLLSGVFFIQAAIYEVYIPVPLCYVLYAHGAMSFSISPYTLAAMALEQYVAICHPLQHAKFCTAYRAHVTFTIICFFSSITLVIELFVMLASLTNIFNLYVICRQSKLVVNPIQIILQSVNVILCFTLVGLVILVTYVKIMLVAHRISSQSSLASKAARTIMLHAFQLLLYLASLLSILVTALQIKQVDLLPMVNFFLFNCLPRFISPMIYGVRDEALRKHMKFYLFHCNFPRISQ